MLIFNNGTKTFSLLHSLIFLLISPVVILQSFPGLIDPLDPALYTFPIPDVGVPNPVPVPIPEPVPDPVPGPVSDPVPGPVPDPNDPDPVPEPHPIPQPSDTQSNDEDYVLSTKMPSTLIDESTIISPDFNTDFQIRETTEIALDSEIKDNTESISIFQTNNISKTLSTSQNTQDIEYTSDTIKEISNSENNEKKEYNTNLIYNETNQFSSNLNNENKEYTSNLINNETNQLSTNNKNKNIEYTSEIIHNKTNQFSTAYISNQNEINQLSTNLKNENISSTTNLMINNETTNKITELISSIETSKINEMNEKSETISQSENIEYQSTNHIINIKSTSNQIIEIVSTKESITSILSEKNNTYLPSTSKNEDIPTTQYSSTKIITTTYPKISTIIGKTEYINNPSNSSEYNSADKSYIESTNLYLLESNLVVLLGFSHYKEYNSSLFFNMYLVPIKNNIYSNNVRFPVMISYNKSPEELIKSEANCIFIEKVALSNYKYSCEIYEDTTNIKQIKAIPDLLFEPEKNITLIGVSPLAKMFMNSLQSLKNRKNDMISNSNIYILDNTTYAKYNRILFNITGTIDGIQPAYENKNLFVMINLESGNRIETEIECDINKISLQSYLLDCKSNEIFEANLQSAISFIDDNEILLINFDYYNNYNESLIKIEENSVRYNSLFFKNNSEKLTPGAIVAIVIILLLATSSIIFLIICLKRREKKKNEDENKEEESTIRKINSSI